MLRSFLSTMRTVCYSAPLTALSLAVAVSACSDDPLQPTPAATKALPVLTANAAVLTVSDTMYNFGSLVVSQVGDLKALTVTNAGVTPLIISNLTYTGPDWTSFAFDMGVPQACRYSVEYAPGQSCTISARFTPQRVGPANAGLIIWSNGGDVTVPLAGYGLTQLQVSPQEVLFDEQVIGTTSLPQAIQFKNLGAKAIKFTGFEFIGLNPADFALTGNANTLCQAGGSLAGGATCDFMVVFKPTAVGSRAASLSITTDAGTTAATLSGTATRLTADAGITMVAALQGKSITYAITLTNAGPDAASQVGLKAATPAGTTFASVSAPSDIACFAPAPGTSGTIACGISSLAAGASRTVQITVKVAVNTKGSVTSQATVSTGSSDPVTSNNTASATVVVGRK